MGFNPPVPQQDSNWEIRVAVQVSLLLQIVLIFVGRMRSSSSSRLARFVVWSCYLLADWVADLALGLLLNNMGNIGGGGGGGGGSSISSAGLKRGGGGGGGATAGSNTSSSSSPIIFAFWTPFLLLHLGGPDTITAYSLEDNELWHRHLIGLLFELFSACVVFFCSLAGNPMIPATVLMFVVGIIKYGERTYSLYCGSVDGFRSQILAPPDPGPNYAKLMTEFDSKNRAGFNVEIAIADGEADKAHKEVEEKETRRKVITSERSVEARAYEFFLIFRRLFANLILSFKDRRLSQTFFLEREDLTTREAFEVIEVELNFIYDMVYTKAPVAHTCAGWVLRSVCSACLASALAIFFLLDKPAHQIERVDVGITYALLLGGLALDAAALLMILFSHRAKVYLELEQWRQSWWARCRVLSLLTPWLARWFLWLTRAVRRWRTPGRWSGETSQLNLITRSLGKPDEDGLIAQVCSCLRRYVCCCGCTEDILEVCSCLRRYVCCCGCTEDILEEFVFIRRVKLEMEEDKTAHHNEQEGRKRKSKSSRLYNFMFDLLWGAVKELQRKEEQEDMDSSRKKEEMMKVCNRRGKGVMERLGDGMRKRLKKDEFDLIVESVEKKDFDESLLLWHIATDLCRLSRDDDTQQQQQQAAGAPPAAGEEDTQQKPQRLQRVGETLSEYMLYLLIKQPDMLSATAGIGLLRYRDTRAEAERFFTSMREWIGDHEEARRMLLSVNTSKRPADVKGDQSKSVLFDAVILAKELRKLGEEDMWQVIAEVWGEMLTYAAGKCRGSTHVRQLNHGGELITLVWFLMAHMGLGDMYQIQEGDAKAKLIVHDQ